MCRRDWRKTVFGVGTAATSAFILLRFFHLYRNSHQSLFGVAAGPWKVQPTLTLTIASFFDTLKYPPSLQFLLMTLGPSLMALAWLGKINTRHSLARLVTVFGRVPLFYYVVHIYVIRTLAVYTALIFKQKAAWLLYGGFMVQLPPQGYGHSLPFIYTMWFGVVLFMYPFCLQWFYEIQATARRLVVAALFVALDAWVLHPFSSNAESTINSNLSSVPPPNRRDLAPI